MKAEKIFHISQQAGIQIFNPRPSPSKFEKITGDVVFGISGTLLHNYMLPRNCPRVTYYAGPQTTAGDRKKFIVPPAEFVMAVETKWLPLIQKTNLYRYEFDPTNFSLVDECAGYYVSYQPERPVDVQCIVNPLDELAGRNNIELRFLTALWDLADEVAQSSLLFSLIRMRNAIPPENTREKN